MDKDISKPNIVRGIPVPLIRPLPTLYYFGRFHSDKSTQKAINFYNGSVQYLTEAVKIVAQETSDTNFYNIAELVAKLNKINTDEIVENVMPITRSLSELCVRHSDKIKNNTAFAKGKFLELYHFKVQPLQVLLIDNHNEPERVSKFGEILQDTCYYHARMCKLNSADFIDKIKTSDFIIFTSAIPISVNDDVQNIQQYLRPCMVLADFKKDPKLDQQIIRNGAWLQQKGYEVLYKIFTPLRLFTTIDKIYMKFQCS